MLSKQFLDSREVFDSAIERGYLSTDPESLAYAGKYMYMHTEGQHHRFKHVDTRRYVTIPVTGNVGEW